MPLHQTELSPTTESGFDANRRYVRVCERRADGFVEFEFAIGERALFVEMMLPIRAFDEFCGIHSVTRIDDGQEDPALSALPS